MTYKTAHPDDRNHYFELQMKAAPLIQAKKFVAQLTLIMRFEGEKKKNCFYYEYHHASDIYFTANTETKDLIFTDAYKTETNLGKVANKAEFVDVVSRFLIYKMTE